MSSKERISNGSLVIGLLCFLAAAGIAEMQIVRWADVSVIVASFFLAVPATAIAVAMILLIGSVKEEAESRPATVPSTVTTSRAAASDPRAKDSVAEAKPAEEKAAEPVAEVCETT